MLRTAIGMSLKLLQYGNPLLRKISQPLPKVTSELQKLVTKMSVLMHKVQGIGLSAIQVGVQQRLFIMQIPELHEQVRVFINPVIVKLSRDRFIYKEGCLSIPRVLFEVKRPRSLMLSYRDLQWAEQEIVAEELEAICIQHELDHLNGKLFIDHVKGKANLRRLRELMEAEGFGWQHQKAAAAKSQLHAVQAADGVG